MILEGFRKVLRGKTFLKAIIVVSLCFFGGTMIPNGETYAGCEKSGKWHKVNIKYSGKKKKTVTMKICEYGDIKYYLPYSAIMKNNNEPDSIDNIIVQNKKKKRAKVYKAWHQGKIEGKYNSFMNLHGCPYCSIATMIQEKPTTVAKDANSTDGLYSDYTDDNMPLNIAGVKRYFKYNWRIKMNYYSTDISKRVKKYTKNGIPIIAVGNGIQANNASGRTWLAEKNRPHTFLIIGRTSEKVAVVIDSTKRPEAAKYRVKFVNIDTLIAGIYKKGVNDSYNNGKFFYGEGGNNGGIAVWTGMWNDVVKYFGWPGISYK